MLKISPSHSIHKSNQFFPFLSLSGSVPLGNYTPIKAQTFDTDYELGVKHAQSSSPNQDQPIHYKTITNSSNLQQPVGSLNISCNGTFTNGITTMKSQKIVETVNKNPQLLNEFGENESQNGDEIDSLQCLKPANDDQTVAWSEGASDLLF